MDGGHQRRGAKRIQVDKILLRTIHSFMVYFVFILYILYDYVHSSYVYTQWRYIFSLQTFVMIIK